VNKILHSEDCLIIGMEEGFLKAKSSRTKVTIQESIDDFRLIKQYTLEQSCAKLMIVFVDMPEVPDNYTELFANALSEDELAFFYDVKIAIVTNKKHYKMFQVHAQFAQSLNVELDLFTTMKKAKAWLKL